MISKELGLKDTNFNELIFEEKVYNYSSRQ